MIQTFRPEWDELSSWKVNVIKRPRLKWGLAGIMVIIPLLLISALSPRFEYGLGDINKPIVPLVALMMASGTFYLWVILRCKGVALGKGLLAWVFILGLLARLVMFASTPALEDDHYRYLWDGGVLANGFNPYK